MAQINLNTLSFFPFQDGDKPTGDQVSELVYYPKETPNSLGVINGQLDHTNINSTVARENIRKGHLSYGKQVSSSANHDIYAFVFRGIQTQADLEDDAKFNAEAIPVLGVNFLVQPVVKEGLTREPSYVRLHWNIGVVSNGSARGSGTYFPDPADFDRADFFARWRLFIDGQPVNAVTRDIHDARYTLASEYTSPGTPPYHTNYPDTRWWSGSYIVENLREGWHSASIRYAAISRGIDAVSEDGTTVEEQQFKFQGRVRARRMGYTVTK
jgi:hypothetical protein